MFLIVFLLLILLILLYILYIKNRYVTLDNFNHEAWSNVKIYLQKRLDLIPNLVNTVKGYASHEKNTLDSVIKARSNLINIDMSNIQNINEIIKNENLLTQSLRSLMMLHEAYPELKANEAFLNLQKELADIENEILATRKYYNATCRTLNIFVQKFPNSLFFNLLKFRKADLFETTEEVNKVPKVEF